MAQGSTPESAGSARPFKYYGKQGEFTLLAPLKPGGAERARALIKQAPGLTGAMLIPTLHNNSGVRNRQRHSHVVRYGLRRRLGPVHRRLCCQPRDEGLIRSAVGEFGGLPGHG